MNDYDLRKLTKNCPFGVLRVVKQCPLHMLIVQSLYQKWALRNR